jgi:hypothetical protein
MLLTRLPPIRFTPEDLYKASQEWSCNCGPTSLAVALGITLDLAHWAIPHFDKRHYTSCTMMVHALRRLGSKFGHIMSQDSDIPWPSYGMARIQWAGPWTEPGVPLFARARHSHWVATVMLVGREDRGVYDCNDPHWTLFEDWEQIIVPHIIKECEPEGNGSWWLTDTIEINELLEV